MAAQYDWTSAVGDLDPAVLAIQLNDDPRIAGEILNKIHNLSDRHERHITIQLYAGSIAWLGQETLARVCEEPEGLQHALVNIVSANFLCGYTQDDFIGPYASWVCSLLLGKHFLPPDAGFDQSKGYTYVVLEILNRTACWLTAGLVDRPILHQSAQETLAGLNPVWDRLAQFVTASAWYDLEADTNLHGASFAIPASCAEKVGLKIVVMHSILR